MHKTRKHVVLAPRGAWLRKKSCHSAPADSEVGNMMRTRQLHARFAYVMRVDNRASIAYATAARSVRRGLLSPEVLMRHAGSRDLHKLTIFSEC
jgi:hypothetical protein